MLEIILVLGQSNEGGAHFVCLAALPSHPQESRNSDTDESTGDIVLSKPLCCIGESNRSSLGS